MGGVCSGGAALGDSDVEFPKSPSYDRVLKRTKTNCFDKQKKYALNSDSDSDIDTFNAKNTRKFVCIDFEPKPWKQHKTVINNKVAFNFIWSFSSRY